jgi:hypothetical protein
MHQASRPPWRFFAVPLAAFVTWVTWVGEGGALAAAAEGTTAAASSAVRIHLHGVARIDAHVARSHGKLVVSGTVSGALPGDLDGAAHLGGVTRVAIEIARTGPGAAPLPATGAPSLVDLAASAPEMCTDVNQAPVLEGAARMLVPTAPLSSGPGTARFCIRLAIPTGKYLVRLESRAVGLMDSAHLDLPVDLGLQTVTLRFDPPLTTVRLDDDAPVSIGVVATTEDDGVTRPAPSLPIALASEAGAGGAGPTLGSATTDAAGTARFVVPAPRLGPAGQGEVRASFAGNATDGPTSVATSIERQLRVVLAFPAAQNGRLPSASVTSSTPLHVVAGGACAARGCRGTPTGTVEVHVVNDGGDLIAGAAALADGKADVVMTFGTGFARGGEAALRVLYLPDAPWFSPAPGAAGSPALVQPLDPPSAWREFGFAGAGVLVLAWLLASRLSLGSALRRPPRRPDDAAHVPTVAIVGPERAPGECRGRVLDAHDATPVAGARVAHERPGFERSQVVTETVADDAGNFVLSAQGLQPGDLLVSEGPQHVVRRMPMPTGGELRVTLIARRRALLERLVAWARRRGAPFDTSPEPTPEHVRRMAFAGQHGSPGAARDIHGDSVRIQAWAGAVEQAAYGGEAVDARREAEVDRLAPQAHEGGLGPRPR